jgi:hypothetical protein
MTERSSDQGPSWCTFLSDAMPNMQGDVKADPQWPSHGLVYVRSNLAIILHDNGERLMRMHGL